MNIDSTKFSNLGNQHQHQHRHNQQQQSPPQPFSSSSLTSQPTFRFGSFDPVQNSLNDADADSYSSSSIFALNVKTVTALPKALFTLAFGLIAACFTFICYTTLSFFGFSFKPKNRQSSKLKPSSTKHLNRSNSESSFIKMEKVDLIVVATIVIGATTFLFRKFIFGSHTLRKNSIPTIDIQAPPKTVQNVANPLRDIAHQMNQKNQNVVLIYGSQTGTAEDLSKRFARELHLDHNAETLVIDPEQYDLESLSKINPMHIAIFLISTTGEGEPTDNMAKWYEALIGEDIFETDFSGLDIPEFIEPSDELGFPEDYEFDNEAPLANLNFAVFGLGNSTYEHFNSPAKQITKRLRSLGAKLVGPLGLGDDDVNIDDDFEKWTTATAPLIAKHIAVSSTALTSTPNKYEPSFIVEVLDNSSLADKHIGTVRPPTSDVNVSKNAPKIDSKNPWYCLPLNAKSLTHPSCERKIIHMELDLEDGKLSYTTGDHVAVLPTNYETQVRLLLKVLKLDDLQPISLKPSPKASDNASFPHNVSTYGSMLRHYLDITSPVPKDSIKHVLLPSAISEPAKAFLQKLIDDKDYYNDNVIVPVMSPGELIQNIQKIEEDAAVPSDLKFNFSFDALLDLLPNLAPRFYSISSSNLESPDKLTITAVVLQYSTVDSINRYGVATNYIHAVHDAVNYATKSNDSSFGNDIVFTSDSLAYNLKDTRKHATSNKLAIPVYIRKSSFRLPSDHSVPIVMVGPGTGIAPFRGFIRERAYQVENNMKVGPTVLFFGNRNKDKDFLYKDELTELFEKLYSSNKDSKLVTAFSRDQPEKIYVQNKMLENSSLVWDLLSKQGGHFYICGDGKSMSKDVISALKQIAQIEGKLDETRATSWLANLKIENRYNEDVWH